MIVQGSKFKSLSAEGGFKDQGSVEMTGRSIKMNGGSVKMNGGSVIMGMVPDMDGEGDLLNNK